MANRLALDQGEAGRTSMYFNINGFPGNPPCDLSQAIMRLLPALAFEQCSITDQAPCLSKKDVLHRQYCDFLINNWQLDQPLLAVRHCYLRCLSIVAQSELDDSPPG
jgi:hypothetical protein